jgi:glycosidase
VPVKTTTHRPTTPKATTTKATTPKAPKAPKAPAALTTPVLSRPADGGPADSVDTMSTTKTWAGFVGDADGGGVNAKIQSLSTPMANSAGRVVFPWDKPGDAIPFEMTVQVSGDPSKVKADLWTNANHNDAPEKYDALPMKIVRTDGDKVTFRVEVPINEVGNYRATARISTNGGQSFQWASAAGAGDIRFRPHVEADDDLNMMEVNINSVNGGHGTLDDLASSGSPTTTGKYTLEFMKSEGINSVWVQPPFKRSQWEYRPPIDNAGSPYATKDFFAVDPDYSARAQQILKNGGTEEQAEAAATQEWKDFVAKAHSMGMKVMVDVALNHVGHNYEFNDLFTRTDAAGNEIREVRKNDFSQVAVNPEQLKVIDDRLADPNLPKYMEYIAPWLYSSKTSNPGGAQDVSDIEAGGGQWYDTKQLNHGGSYGVANPAENKAVVDYMGRVLEYWSVDMGCDGFRLDHLTGLPQTVLEDSLNHAQAAVDKHRPGTELYVTGEDFFNAEYNASYVDNIQDTWLRNTLMGSTSPGNFRDILSNPYFDNREMLNLSSHDEDRFDFHGDTRAAARMYGLLPLLGGTDMLVAGDDLGETNPMPFKQYNPIESILHPSQAGAQISEQLRRAGTAKTDVPALQDDNRTFLDPRVGGADPDILAISRYADAGKPGNPVLVFANMNNGMTRENSFNLDSNTKARLDPSKHYQVRDLMADNPDAALWNKPMTGQDLMNNGIYAKLAPYQTQALEIYEVP